MTPPSDSFLFRVSRVERLPRINLGVLEGQILQGKVLPGQQVTLVHGDRRMPMRVESLLGGMRSLPGNDAPVSLSFTLRSMAFDLVAAGDELVAA